MAETTRDIVFHRHNADIKRALDYDFITSKNRNAKTPVNPSQMVCCAVSTTQHSTILILSLGLDSCFTRNTYSKDPNNPWLIFEYASENKPWAQHITNIWQNMATPGQRDQVDEIAKHVVYLLVDNQFILQNLACDENNNVRLKVEDIEIWSHPPRDEPLRAALNSPTFKQKEGNVRAEARGYNRYINIRGNQRVLPENVTKKLESLRQKFDILYGFYEDIQSNIPDSYKWPTLQLGQNCNFQPGQAAQNVQPQDLQRYGDTFAGVYGTRDNEAHNKFPAPGVQPRGYNLPSRESVFNDLLAAEGLTLTYADVFINNQ